jgi:iron complex outermembrane receptor protein
MNGSPPQQDASGQPRIAPIVLKSLSLEELSQIEVTTPSKQPVKAFQTPSAIYVITGGTSGAPALPAYPRPFDSPPVWKVARIDANKWSIGIRSFGSG